MKSMADRLRWLLKEYYPRMGIKNINCGILRGIGKTHCLRQLIEEEGTKENPIYIMVRTLGVAKTIYGDLIKKRICRPVTPNCLERLEGVWAEIYSDEVPEAEKLLLRFPHCKYLGGFYNDWHATYIILQKKGNKK